MTLKTQHVVTVVSLFTRTRYFDNHQKAQFSAILLDAFTNSLQTLSMKKFVNSVSKEILDGVYLTQTTASPVWQTYFRAHGKTYRKTTRKRDFEQAKMAALSMYYDIQRDEAGLDKPTVASFHKLAEVYKAHVEKRMMSNYHIDTLNRHFVPYFGEVTDVREITQPMIIQYIEWRLAKSGKPPTPQTLNRENTVLRQIFRHAAIQGWLDEPPEIPNYSEKNTRK